MKLLLAVSLVLVANTARADQCAYVSPEEAAKAKAIVAKSAKVIAFCELCGDKAPGAPIEVQRVDITTPGDGQRELHINNEAVDLAYTYVLTSKTRYTNLALLAGCEHDSASPSLEVTGETRHGVLITADDKIGPPQPSPAIATVPIAVPMPVAAPPTVYVYATKTEHVSWPALLFACGGGFAIGAGFLLTALALRRRRAMRPRAAELGRDRSQSE